MEATSTVQRPVTAARSVIWEIPALALLAVVGFWCQSFPDTGTTAILGGLLCGFGFVVGAVLSLALRVGRRRTVALAMAVIIAISVGSSVTRWPLRLRFLAAAAEFDTVVKQAGPPPPAGPVLEWSPFPTRCPDTIGSFGIRRCEAVTAGYLFVEADGGFFDETGFAYLPGGAETLGSDGSFELQSVEHLKGDWYVFVNSW